MLYRVRPPHGLGRGSLVLGIWMVCSRAPLIKLTKNQLLKTREMARQVSLISRRG